MANKYDVVIIGAGPAGAAAARRCVEADLSTVIVEKHKLPRRKACSGIIAHGAWRFLKDNFGPIPKAALCNPELIKGVTLHFEHAPSITVNASTPVPYVWRANFDNWLVERSGAQVMEETTFTSLRERKNEVEVRCTKDEKKIVLTSKYVIAADGGLSSVVRLISPESHEGVAWAVAFQRYYKGQIGLDGNYFHGFFAAGLGLYPWTNMKNGQMIIGCACSRGQKIEPYHRALISFLEKRHALKLGDLLYQEGCQGNTMTAMNKFCMGRGRVLVAGEAAGFLHMAGEGISCALKTGAIAGETVADALHHNREAVPDYVIRTKHERDIALDQWNPLRMVESSEMLVDMDGALKGIGRKDKLLMIMDIMNVARGGWGTGLGTNMMKNMLKRKFLGEY